MAASNSEMSECWKRVIEGKQIGGRICDMAGQLVWHTTEAENDRGKMDRQIFTNDLKKF